jgi:hypothetical protein
VISDLLKPERTNLGIREDRKRGIYVDGLSEWVVRTPEEVIATIRGVLAPAIMHMVVAVGLPKGIGMVCCNEAHK